MRRMIATIRPGVLTIHSEQTAPMMIVVRGGFAEVGASGVTVLAQEVVPVDEIDPATIQQAIKDAEEDIADAKPMRSAQQGHRDGSIT